ncbi:MAG: hypothetical protein AAF514_05495, partial [Verrucomicrobiota bacterium]
SRLPPLTMNAPKVLVPVRVPGKDNRRHPWASKPLMAWWFRLRRSREASSKSRARARIDHAIKTYRPEKHFRSSTYRPRIANSTLQAALGNIERDRFPFPENSGHVQAPGDRGTETPSSRENVRQDLIDFPLSVLKRTSRGGVTLKTKAKPAPTLGPKK